MLSNLTLLKSCYCTMEMYSIYKVLNCLKHNLWFDLQPDVKAVVIENKSFGPVNIQQVLLNICKTRFFLLLY